MEPLSHGTVSPLKTVTAPTVHDKIKENDVIDETVVHLAYFHFW